LRNQITGKVIKNNNEKSLIVSVNRLSSTHIKGKMIKKRSKYVVHDPNSQGKVGDTVLIEECKPVSYTKKWRFIKTISSGITEIDETTESLDVE
tara:strand:- start:888 stop:1169 length:282 start_codon:yes stop_codon:yes gene_type:complete